MKSIGDQIRKWEPDVIAMVEADKRFKLNLDAWRSELPGYDVVGTYFGAMIAVRGEVLKHEEHRLRPLSWCESFDIRVDGKEFTVIIADIASHLFLSRRRPLAELAQMAQERSDRPLVIVGDFNTPDDSIHFGPLREQCSSAFREHGSGYAPTWPMIYPVLTLDQIWTNSLATPSACEHFWSTSSDHRPVIVRLQISGAAESAQSSKSAQPEVFSEFNPSIENN
jgi:endonuclease/exonuclease/phosphatase (EEP) superfamily protein YafD